MLSKKILSVNNLIKEKSYNSFILEKDYKLRCQNIELSSKYQVIDIQKGEIDFLRNRVINNLINPPLKKITKKCQII